MLSKTFAAAAFVATATASFKSEVMGPQPTGDQLKNVYECEGCEKFANFGIGKLIRALEGGIPASCAALCEKAVSNQIEGEICVALCAGAGLYEFINLISTEDISPLWLCIEAHACPQTTCTSNCAKVSNFQVSPTAVTPPGVVDVTYDITFAEGVGVVTTLAQFAFGPAGANQTQWGSDTESLIISPTAGEKYQVKLQSHTEISEGQQGNICADPGNYTTTAVVCEGQCGDTFKKSGPVLTTGQGPNLVINKGSNCQPASQANKLN